MYIFIYGGGTFVPLNRILIRGSLKPSLATGRQHEAIWVPFSIKKCGQDGGQNATIWSVIFDHNFGSKMWGQDEVALRTQTPHFESCCPAIVRRLEAT